MFVGYLMMPTMAVPDGTCNSIERATPEFALIYQTIRYVLHAAVVSPHYHTRSINPAKFFNSKQHLGNVSVVSPSLKLCKHVASTLMRF